MVKALRAGEVRDKSQIIETGEKVTRQLSENRVAITGLEFVDVNGIE